MIIPQYRASSPKRMAKPDINEPIREAAAKSRVVDQATAIAKKAKGRHDKYASDKATAEMTSQIHEMELANANKQFYEADEIPDDIGVQKTETIVTPQGEELEQNRSRIPSYEVFPRMLDTKVQAHIDSNSANLPASVRSSWKLRAEETKGKINQAVLLNSAQQQQQQIRVDQEASFKEAMLNRDYTTAMVVANAYEGSNSERLKYKNVAMKGEEQGDYYDEMSEENMPAMVASLEYLQAEDYEGKGRLTPSERNAMISALNGKMNQIKSRLNAGREGKNLQIKSDVKNMSDNANKGYTLNTEAVLKVDGQLNDEWSKKPEGKLAETKFNWDKTIADSASVNAFVQTSVPAQEAYIAQLPSETGDQIATKNRFQSAMDNGINERDKDSMTYAENIGMVKPVKLDPNNLVGSLAARQANNNAIMSRYGYSSGPLKEGEAAYFTEEIATMTSGAKVEFFTDIHSALGNGAVALYQQVDPKGTNPNMSAGILNSKGRPAAARYLLQGDEWAKQNPSSVPKKMDLNIAYTDSVAGTYSQIASEQSRSMGGITAIYNGLSQETGDVGGEFEQDRWDTAVEMYTGGVYEVGDSSISAPEGWSQKDVTKHVKLLNSEYWNDQGGVQGYQDDYDQLSKDIRNGNVMLKQIGDNDFLMFSNVVNAQLLTPKGSAARFSFDRKSKTNPDRTFIEGISDTLEANRGVLRVWE